jgi:uncharacterized protein YprB with RNaseH-like and TPR domain
MKAFDLETLGTDPMVHRIVAYGWIEFTGKEIADKKIVLEEDEKKMLEMFWKDVYGAVLVGYNIKRFDYWFVCMRSLKHGIKINPTNQLIDIMEILFPQGQRWKRLSDVAEFLGIESKEKSGAMVCDAWLNRRDDEIIKYLEKDLEITFEVFQRISR